MIIAFTALSVAFATHGAPNYSVSRTDHLKIEDLLARMSLKMKVDMLGGVDSFYTHPIPELGIPKFVMSDGPLGLRNQGPSTAYPAGATLAASWDPTLAEAFGTAIGIDARARGVNYWLGPGVDLDRIPQNGRNFEYLGEDPFLSATMAVPIIRGVQAQGVAATVKHYACNDNENDRQADDSLVDERTLHEVQLVPFEAAVKQGGVWAIMDGYNLVNGEHDSQNKVLLTDILKKQWGFKGVVMSDWGATHDGVAAFNGGQDLEMPGPDYMNETNLLPLLQSGKLSESLLNDKVTRQLRVAYALHWMDRPQVSGQPWVQAKNDAVALRIAEEGTTLLANPRSILPLATHTRVVVVGPNAEPAVTNGGGSSFVDPHAKIGLVSSIKKEIPGADVAQVPYRDTDHFLVNGTISSENQAGWKMELFNNVDLASDPVFVSRSNEIDFNWSKKAPDSSVGHDNYSVRWTGEFSPEATANYLIEAKSDDGMRVFVDGKKVVNMWQDQGATEGDARFHFEKDRTYQIEVDYYQRAGDAIAKFGIVNLQKPLFSASQSDLIKSANVVIANVGFNPSLEGEGQDRPYALPVRQQAFLDSVMKLNSKVVIVLNAGGAVDIGRWIHAGAALIDSYYPGENGNQAIAKILYGRLNPSGKLPFVFPAKLGDLLSTGTYPAVNNKIHYKEGIFIGQRGLDRDGKTALFPFGFGLSYSTFDSLKSRLSILGSGGDQVLELSGSLRNRSNRGGSDVIEAYVGFPRGPVARPVGQLAGFSRLYLRAGQTGRFQIQIPLKSLGFWNVHTHNWDVTPGVYTIELSDQGLMPYGRIRGRGNGWKGTFSISRALSAQINRKEKP